MNGDVPPIASVAIKVEPWNNAADLMFATLVAEKAILVKMVGRLSPSFADTPPSLIIKLITPILPFAPLPVFAIVAD